MEWYISDFRRSMNELKECYEKNLSYFFIFLFFIFQILPAEQNIFNDPKKEINIKQADQQLPVTKNVLKDVIIVSLGSHCEVAAMIRSQGERYFATPVDWLLSLDHKGLVSLINDNFKQMFNIEYLYQYPEGYVVNSLYKIDFRHDWPTNDLAGPLPKIQEMYERRIERFLNLHEISGRVFFVRSAFDSKLNVADNMPFYTQECFIVTAAEAEELRDSLEKKFSRLKFILVVINYEEEHSPVIVGRKNIIEFKVRKSHKVDDYLKIVPLLANCTYFDQLYT